MDDHVLDSARGKDDKLPHDASVFVGSLPSNIDQGDLTRMLMEHLSDHTQVKNIKVVRDSKGGVCAFVQCENAASASALIGSIESQPPKPFLGRILRYEPARAFRTLLISYRAPSQQLYPVFIQSSPTASSKREVQLEAPSAMRIAKQENSRFHSILYNSEAIQAEAESGQTDSGTCNSIFLSTMAYDGQTLRSLATYFGRLETFKFFESSDGNTDGNPTTDISQYPAPHNGPRAAGMERHCWEIKWEHRDDCVCALMTLRRVPHLTVTWAHQPSSHGSAVHQGLRHGSPRFPYQFQLEQNTNLVPYARSPVHTPRFRQHAQPISPATPHNQHPTYPFPLLVEGGRISTPNSSWDEEGTPSVAWANVTPTDHPWNRRSGPVVETPTRQRSFNHDGRVKHPRGVTTADENSELSDFGGQELFAPPTPTLDTSSITPMTPGSQFPITPTTSGGYEPSHTYAEKGDIGACRDPGTDREIDPTTLFVGGLEMFGPGAWDEMKLRSIFSRFGGLESVKVVRPLNASAGFAFVKFNNAESPARAVHEEHGRVYEGREIRVQLRDCNPPRNTWKFNRGRGRLHYNSQRRFNVRLPYAQQDKCDLSNMDRSGAANLTANDEIRLSSLVNALPSPPSDTLPTPMPTELQKQLDDDSSTQESSQPERYREWYDDIYPTNHAPAPSPSMTSTTGLSYTTSPYPYSAQFFPPPPASWMHPCMPPATYPMPYYPGYPLYSPAPMRQAAPALPVTTSPQSSEASGPPAVPVQPSWPGIGVYGSFIPYPVMTPKAPNVEHSSLAQAAPQPPVVPTGFIQNEQGTLIAVYPPDALNQYMAGSGPGDTTPSSTNVPDIGSGKWVPPNGAHPPHNRSFRGQTRTLNPPSQHPHRFYADTNGSWTPSLPISDTGNSLSGRMGRRDIQRNASPAPNRPHQSASVRSRPQSRIYQQNSFPRDDRPVRLYNNDWTQ